MHSFGVVCGRLIDPRTAAPCGRARLLQFAHGAWQTALPRSAGRSVREPGRSIAPRLSPELARSWSAASHSRFSSRLLAESFSDGAIHFMIVT